jgi:hypothetical protein
VGADGEPLDTEEWFDLLHQHFNVTTDHREVPDLGALCPARDERIYATIQTKEIRDVIRLAATKSAPGGDHITWSYLKKALSIAPTLTTHLAVIFDALLTRGVMPPSLKRAETVIIPKPDKSDYTKPKAWRPIALLSCISNK